MSHEKRLGREPPQQVQAGGADRRGCGLRLFFAACGGLGPRRVLGERLLEESRKGRTAEFLECETPRHPNPLITTGETGRGGRPGDPWPLRPIRFHPQGAACRGEAALRQAHGGEQGRTAPRPYLLVACPHVIDGLGGRLLLRPFSNILCEGKATSAQLRAKLLPSGA
jgi:hypothetical protein